jgi:hypothetical protein
MVATQAPPQFFIFFFDFMGCYLRDWVLVVVAQCWWWREGGAVRA